SSGQTRLAWGRRLTVAPAPASPLVELAEGHYLLAQEQRDSRRPRRHRRLREFRQAVRAFFDRRLAATAGAISLLLLASVVVFHVFDHLGWVDSLYFTVTTASTTGYGDFNLQTA